MTGSRVGRGLILLSAVLVIIGLVNLSAPDQIGTGLMPPAGTSPALGTVATSLPTAVATSPAPATSDSPRVDPGAAASAITTASSSDAVATQNAGTPAGTGPWAAALTELNALPVLAFRPNAPGYERGCKPTQACSFGPAWTDDTNAPDGHNGCGTRDDMLRRQLVDVQYRAGSGCVVVAGTLHDPYTGQPVPFAKAQAAEVQVDHLVPLALAWDLGASTWTQDQRNIFANDTETELMLTSRPANSAKSDRGPATWMPPDTTYWCTYSIKFTGVLFKYQLPVVRADKDAMTMVLASC